MDGLRSILMNGVDTIIRELLPVVIEANGRKIEAERLRSLPELSSRKSIEAAQIELEALRSSSEKNIILWCEVAIWAASNGNLKTFRDAIKSLTRLFLLQNFNSKNFPS